GPLIGNEPAVIFTLEAHSPQGSSISGRARMLQEEYQLSDRETEVAVALGKGLSNREIGIRLGISLHTVRRHCEHIFAKLGVHRRAGVAGLLAESGLDRTP
ncbi:MAG TPA: helix-turn-helix transcriptional regulator, partial [Gemmatimonadales bacterium]|nr:helix-turn-helix transcriptional regulator [Gemmatimonadales bacterium]